MHWYSTLPHRRTLKECKRECFHEREVHWSPVPKEMLLSKINQSESSILRFSSLDHYKDSVGICVRRKATNHNIEK